MVDYSLSRNLIPKDSFHYGISHILEHGKKKAQLVNISVYRDITELQA